jgi:eukaryotic-like serine/threonine-protein kinase
MNIPAADWPRLFKLLDTALELEEPARATWVEQLTGDEAALKSPLLELLAQHAKIETAEFLAQPAQAAAAFMASGIADSQETLRPDAIIGQYKLLREIGRGGMGTVWLAERADYIKRQVALKLPYAGPLQSQLAARFARERDILAALTHPSIARLYDAGAAESGQPFLAMEYVEGRPINEYCDEHKLDIRKRIELFLQVLRAVQYAHANLVVHRDLKPNNILVTSDGQAKLLDFGIAKLVSEGEINETALTQFGGRALTPDYASPEQIAGGTINTGSDVYSLGVMFFELLTGQRPYKLKRDSRGALEDAILNAQTPPPSHVAISDEAAEARGCSRDKLRKQLAGDLDVVALKALKKSPLERYATVEAFAQDIERYLNNQPVLAQADSAWYRARKFVARNKVIVAATLAVMMALLAGLLSTSWQAQRARVEAQRAQAVRGFLVKLFSASNPEEARGKVISAREMLDRGAQNLDKELSDQPDVLADLHREVAAIYLNMGLSLSAKPHIDRALYLYKSLHRDDGADYLDALVQLAEVQLEEAQYDDTRATNREGAELARRNFGEPNRWQGLFLAGFASAEMEQGRPKDAERLILQALDAQRSATTEMSRDYMTLLTMLGDIYLNTGEYPKARDTFIKAKALAKTVPQHEVTDGLVCAYDLARALYNLRDYAGAKRELIEALPVFDQYVGPQHDRTINTRGLLALTLTELGDIAAAIQVQSDNVKYASERSTVDEEALQIQKTTLARTFIVAGRYADAVALVKPALAFLDNKYSSPTRSRERARWLLGRAELGTGAYLEAVQTLEQAVQNASQIQGAASNPGIADMKLSLSAGYRLVGRYADAVSQAEAACVIYQLVLGTESVATARCNAQLAFVRSSSRDKQESAQAAELFDEARNLLATQLPPGSVALAELTIMESELVRAKGQAQLALQLTRQGREAYQKATGRSPTDLFIELH